MVPGKTKYQNSCWGEIRGQLRIMCTIKIMEYILGSTKLVVNICDKMRSLRRATIHPEALMHIWKQVDLISRLSDVQYSMDSGMSMLHVYGYHNIRRPESTLTPLESLNVRLYTLEKHIIAEFLLSSATRNTIAIGFLDPHRIPNVSIHGDPVQSNITQYIS